MVKVKICGITRVQDALLASDLGASAIGFVFWRKSPRYVDPVEATAIAAQLPADVAPIGVFVDPSLDQVRQVVDQVGLAAVQLHGDESSAAYREWPYRVIKAIAVRGATTVDIARAVPAGVTVLLDAADDERKGGTGRTSDWLVARSIAAQRRTFLAGGLRPSNVAEAIRVVNPYGLDVSSGVEAAPGRKDPARLRALFDEVARA